MSNSPDDPRLIPGHPQRREGEVSAVTVSRADWPAQKDWPKPGWKHALNHQQFRRGGVFGWHEDGHLWTGIVEETATCSIKVRDVMPGVLEESP